MALFSQRFWNRLAVLDARVVMAQKQQRVAVERMLVAQQLVTGAGLLDYWRELRTSTTVAEQAASDLTHFCVGRNRTASAVDVANLGSPRAADPDLA